MSKIDKTRSRVSTDYSKVFAKNLSAVAEKLGWSQSELGRKLGVSQGQARNYLNGVSSPPFEMMGKIEEITGSSFANFLKTDRIPEPHVERHDLASEIKAAVTESSEKANSKLMHDIFERLGPALEAIRGQYGADEVIATRLPVEKLSEFLNNLVKKPGLSDEFYRLLDEGADEEILRVEFMHEIAKALLSSKGKVAKNARDVLAELLGPDKKAKG